MAKKIVQEYQGDDDDYGGLLWEVDGVKLQSTTYMSTPDETKPWFRNWGVLLQ